MFCAGLLRQRPTDNLRSKDISPTFRHGVVVTGTLSSVELMAATGATYRQVSYWAHRGYIGDGSRGSGNYHSFDADDVAFTLALVAVSAVVKSGFTETVKAANTGTGEFMVIGPNDTHRGDDLDALLSEIGPAALVVRVPAIALVAPRSSSSPTGERGVTCEVSGLTGARHNAGRPASHPLQDRQNPAGEPCTLTTAGPDEGNHGSAVDAVAARKG